MGKKVLRNSNSFYEEKVSAEDLFTDREEPRKAFWDIYNSLGNGEYDVISYYGVGGVGKSTLLKKLGKELEEASSKRKLDYVYYSFECEPTKAEFLYSLSRKMMIRNKGLHFPLLDTAIAKMAEEGEMSLSDLQEKGKNIFSTEVAGLAASAASEVLPYVGTITQVAESVVNLGKKIKDDWEKEKGKNRSIYSDIAYNGGKDAAEKLHEYFAKDAIKTFEQRDTPFVVFLDGYEKYVNRGDKADKVDYWMYDADTGLVNHLPNTIWVIAGRNKLNWPEEVLESGNCHRIGNLSREDSSTFFKKAGITDEKLIESLFNLTSGTPAFLDLCLGTYYRVIETRTPTIDDFGKNTEKLAQRYLENMDTPKQVVLQILSCLPNVWTEDMALEIIERLGYGNKKDILDKLLLLSIFERYPEGIRMHETVREVIRKNTDKAKEFETTIFNYLKESVLSNDERGNLRNLLLDFCRYLDRETESVISSDEMVMIIDTVANEFSESEDYRTCENCIESIINYCEGNEFDSDVIVIGKNVRINNLIRLGLYEGLEEYALHTYDFAKKHLGEEDFVTLDSLNCLGRIYLFFGSPREAKKAFEKGLKLEKETLGQLDPRTLPFQKRVSHRSKQLAELQEDHQLLLTNIYARHHFVVQHCKMQMHR